MKKIKNYLFSVVLLSTFITHSLVAQDLPLPPTSPIDPSTIPTGEKKEDGPKKAKGKKGATPRKKYIKRNIVEARFGSSDRQKLMESAYQIREKLNQKIIGQERATYALQEALIQILRILWQQDQRSHCTAFYWLNRDRKKFSYRSIGG